MTTDITELAKSLKAAANTTADAIDRLKAFPGDELIDLSQHEGEQVDIDIATLNQWYELSSPDNILALVEALEKALRYIEELREWNAGLAQESCERQQRISELLEGKVGNALLERENHHVELVGKLAERIAELESRTVKLPPCVDDLHGIGMVMPADAVIEMLAAAGIKVEAE
ncbi:TPA: ead/Ea22-like family protein [Klebsiella pneumoniae]